MSLTSCKHMEKRAETNGTVIRQCDTDLRNVLCISLKFSSPTSGGMALKQPACTCCSRPVIRVNAFSDNTAWILSSMTSRHLFVNSWFGIEKIIIFYEKHII